MIKKRIALLLSLLMIISSLAACSGGAGGGTSDGGGDNNGTLVVGYSNFSSKFSPFFAESQYDRDAADMTGVYLLDIDRLGAVVEKGKTGQKSEYNGTEYTYEGLADLTITENADGSVDYDFDLRDNVKFSDGEPLTADDVIFSMYVLSDPTYDGSSTFFAQPIKGMAEYRKGMDSLYNLIVAAGKDNTDFSKWDEGQQKALWETADKASVAIAQEIVDYCGENGLNDAGDVKASAANWGFEVADGATVEDFAAKMMEDYGNDIVSLIGTENAGSTVDALFPNYSDYQIGVKTEDSKDFIEGIQKTGDYGVKVTLTEKDATAIYQLGVPVTPLHYYGDKAQYDYDAHKFGFPKGDLSSVRAKTTEPMGAGPYKFIKYENGAISYEANEHYYLGAPKVANMILREAPDQDKLNGVITGTIDITDPTFSLDNAKAISAENSNGEVTGDKITTSTVDNLGYGYLGIDAAIVNVGGDKGSDASKALRKAFATVFSRYRDVTVDSYYGETASVINYPISNTSWAAPQKTDDDYAIAFSKDVDGNDIYTSDMDDNAKDEAALKAALGFFEKAGYTVADGKVTAAPEGAKMDYEVWIPADGTGDHPSFMMLNLSKEALAKIGITLNVKDLANSSDLWSGLETDKDVPMWCAAWQATPDPDMYQIYYSGVESGKEAGGSNYMYSIADPELDKLIMDARTNTDQAYRKAVYKSCLDTIIDWAVEVPVYQRQNAVIFSTERVNIDTVVKDITSYYGWLREIQKLELAK